MENIFKYVFTFCLGICVGSFINVCIYRLPRNISVNLPRSHCTFCGTILGPKDLFPLVSQLLLLGKCRYCKSPISYRYFGIELVSGLMALLVVQSYGFTPLTLFVFLTIVSLVIVVFVDLEFLIILNQTVWVIALAGIIAQITTFEIGEAFLNSFLGAIYAGGALYAVRVLGKLIFQKEAMGLGDVKLISALGIWLWNPPTNNGYLPNGVTLLSCLLLAIFLGAFIGIMSKISRPSKSGLTYIPFGPMLAISGAMGVLYPVLTSIPFMLYLEYINKI